MTSPSSSPAVRASASADSNAPAIECQALVKHYGSKVAVAGIDLVVQRGQCFGLLGPNGAGKTTTVEMLEGLHPPTSGTIRIFGARWGEGRDQWIRERFGVQLQDTQLADKLTVEEVLTLFRSFYATGRSVSELLALLDLEEERRQQFSRLSGGQKQRVAIATALAGAPDLLFLDEPTTGLDPRARQTLWGVVEAFRSAGGTVLLTTHYMEEAATLCDELAVMDQGRIIARGSPRALIDSLGEVQFVDFESPQTPDSAALLALPAVHAVDRRGARYRLRIERSLRALTAVLEELERQGVTPIGLSTHQATLDDVFLHLTGRGLSHE
ncbi:MAG: ABC transporter ATP-binding protein [Myxococcales bacterium]|jgi:ABC-2 type transport system ATP-binding protein|nr:ABC transporter ATP-binding protein [Myxococcales bacterium]